VRRTHHPRHAITIQIGKLIFGSQANESQKGIIVPGLFVSGGRNAERGMNSSAGSRPDRQARGGNQMIILFCVFLVVAFCPHFHPPPFPVTGFDF
jgi:hypothetical protein